jgi:hypothetical protein
MAELKDREKDEQELTLLLLLLFASNDMEFWLSGYQTPQWFEGRLRQLGLQERLLNTSIRAREGMLKELRRDIEFSQLDRRITQVADVYTHDIAGRLSKRHTEWYDEWIGKTNEYNWRLRRGESVPGLPQPKPSDIYGDNYARRESASTVTDVVSETEINAAREVERQHGTRVTAIWRTEADPCPICESMRNQPQEVWSRRFPKGPKAHPNCSLPETVINPFAGHRIIAGLRAVYRGPVIEIELSDGMSVRLTKGHPVPVGTGLLPAAKVRAGDVCLISPQEPTDGISASQLFDSMYDAAGSIKCHRDVPSYALHGDGGKVQDGVTLVAVEPLPIQWSATGDDWSALRDRVLLHRHVTDVEPMQSQTVVRVTQRPYSGYVYDFQSSGIPYYFANRIAVHNCRCHLEWREVL